MVIRHTVAISNQKGGVGKSTTAINLSSALAYRHQNALLVDMDPQGHATLGLGIDTSNKLTIADLLIDESISAKEVLHNTFHPNLTILPADLSLAAAELKLSSMSAREFRLRRCLEDINTLHWDYVIIDCPPTFGTLSVNAFLAAKHVILPVQLGYFSLEGVNSFMDTLGYINKNVGRVVNHEISVLGVLMTFFDTRTKLSREILEQLQKTFGSTMFETTIPQNVKLNEAQANGLSIFDHAPESSGAKSYEAFTEEFMHRIKNV